MRVLEIYEGRLDLPYSNLLLEVNKDKHDLLTTLTNSLCIDISEEVKDLSVLGEVIRVDNKNVEEIFDLIIKRIIRNHIKEEFLFVSEDWRVETGERIVFTIYEKQNTVNGTERRLLDRNKSKLKITLLNYFYTNQLFFMDFYSEEELVFLFRSILRAKDPLNPIKKSLQQKGLDFGTLPNYKEGEIFINNNLEIIIDNIELSILNECYLTPDNLPSLDYVEEEIEYIEILIDDLFTKYNIKNIDLELILLPPDQIEKLFSLKKRLKKLQSLKELLLLFVDKEYSLSV